MASASGLPCRVDPALVAALRSQKSGEYIMLSKQASESSAKFCLFFVNFLNSHFNHYYILQNPSSPKDSLIQGPTDT